MDKYSDSFLDEKFSVVSEKMDDHFEATTKILGDIKTQTTATNGRVTKLEGDNKYFKGGAAVFMFFIAFIVLPILGILGWKIIELDKELTAVKTSIDL